MKTTRRRAARRGFLATEAIVALGILTVLALPLAYSFLQAPRRVAADYQRTVALELVDGEAEILAAGAARAVPDGLHSWTIAAASVTNLPPGQFTFLRQGSHGRLEWRPDLARWGRPVVREFFIQDPAKAEDRR